MKTSSQSKSNHASANPSGSRSAGIQPHSARALEHRYERRKIREQLRRQDWTLNQDDEFFA
ncbi:MAG TPA: hypothetical protein VG347_00660 [Verrucomicrobiae bacterium]|nr:hypothetical protein [Verrucomicrobiae bacterium]